MTRRLLLARKRLWILGVLAGAVILVMAGFAAYSEVRNRSVDADGEVFLTAKNRLMALEEKILLHELSPPPVRDEDNFFADPFWSESCVVDLGVMESLLTLSDTVALAEKRTLVIPAPDDASHMLAELAAVSVMLGELERLAKRPLSRSAIAYEDGFNAPLPHLRYAVRSARLLRMRAAANLALGNEVAAGRDVRIIYRLSEAIATEPLIPSLTTAMSLLEVANMVTSAGLGVWSDTTLAELQSQLHRINLIEKFPGALRGERGGFNLQRYELIRASMTGASADLLKASAAGSDTYQFLDMEHIFYNLAIQSWITAVQEDFPRLNPGTVNTAMREISAIRKASVGENTTLPPVSLIFPMLPKTAARLARSQASVRQLEFACAIERFRNQHDRLPLSAAELTPEFISKIPDDPVGFGPLLLTTVDSESYIIHSTGWDNPRVTQSSPLQETTLEWVYQSNP